MFLLCLFRRFSGVYRGYCTGLQWLNAHVLIALRVCSYGMGSDDGMRSDDGRSYIVRVKGQGGGMLHFRLSVRQFVSSSVSFLFVSPSVHQFHFLFVSSSVSFLFVSPSVHQFHFLFVSSSVTFLFVGSSASYSFVSSSVRQ